MRSVLTAFCLMILLTGPNAASQPLQKGVEFLENGQYEQAKGQFLRSNTLEAAEFLGDLASFRKNWNDAVKYYKKLVEQEPSSAVYNFKLGGALGMKAMEIGKLQAVFLIDDIKKYLNNAAELDSTHAEVRRALVEFYTELPMILGGSRDTAEGFATELETINPIDAALAWAYIFQANDEHERAKQQYARAISLATTNKNYISRNYLNYELGKASAVQEVAFESGIVFLQNYIKNYGYKDLKPPAWAYFRLAQIKAAQHNKKEALLFIDQALQEMPDLEPARAEKERILKL